MGLLEYSKGKRDTSYASHYDDSVDPSNIHTTATNSNNNVKQQHRSTEKGRSNSNSTFVQRYLAAILDNDVVELIYPPSPARQQKEKKQDRQQQKLQQQQLQGGTSSPSGRSKSSHTTKSTKYTVRTVGSDSMAPTTPSSSTATSPTGIMKLRRKLHQQQPPQSSSMATNPTSASTSTSTRTTTKMHQISSRSYDSTEYRNTKNTNHSNQLHNESTTSSPSRNTTKGFFGRALLQKQNDRELRPTIPSPPRSTNNNIANSYNLSIRKWKQKIRTTNTKDNDNSVGTSLRPLPSSTNQYSKTDQGPKSSSKRVNAYEQQQNHFHSARKHNDNEDNSNNDDDDDDDSSLTSRHTTERRRSHRHRGRSFRRHDDNEQDEDISSYEDDDDDVDDDESTLSDNQGQQPRYSAHHRGTQQNKSNNQSSQKMFSIVEKTVEDGLDMIFNTNGWTCVVPQQLIGEEQQQQVSSAATTTRKSKKMVLPSSVRDTKHIQGTTCTAKITTPPPYQRRMQRHYDDNNVANNSIRLSTSMETPQSDGGATDIITNRAMDIALKRIHQMESIPAAVGDTDGNVHYIPKQHYQGSRSSYSKPAAVTPEQGTPIQLHSNDQNNSDRRVPQSRVKQTANIFENQSRTYQNKISTTKTTKTNHNNTGKLGLHLRDTKKQEQHQLEQQAAIVGGDIKSLGGGTNKSLSSSVGVEIDARYRIPDRSQFRMKVNGPQQRHYQQRPPLIETPSDEWMNVELPYEPEISNRSKAATMVHRSYDNNRATVEPAPLLSTTFRSPTPTRRVYNTIDPCMSPPQIVRKPQQSYDEMSPDPIFCSKSMSMSIQSSNIFSPEQSSNNSLAPSCQTDDAMFMERPDESCSPLVSHVQNSVSGNSTKMQPNNILGYQSKDAREVSTSRTETTFDSHTEEEHLVGESPTNNEQSSSPYMEILGIRGTFPTAPCIPDRGYSTPQQISHYQIQRNLTESTVPNMVPLVPLESPSPPPLIGDSFNLSREYYRDTYTKEQSSSSNVKLLLRCSPKLKDTSYDGKTGSRTTIAKPEPIRSKPASVPGFGVKHDQSTMYSSNNALATKLSRSGASLNDSDADGRSIDVKSIRSAFESIIGSLDPTIENDNGNYDDDDDDDDDTASVRSLRERFEPPKVVVPTESRISKARAIFEKNTNIRKHPDSTTSSHAGRILNRRMILIDDINQAKDKLQHYNASNVLLLSSDFRENVQNPNEVDAVVVKQPITVADRVRAFNVDQQKQMRVKEINNMESIRYASMMSRSNPTTGMIPGNKPYASTKAAVSITSPSLVDQSPSKRSPRNKMSSLRSLGGKAFSCGPTKELNQSFDVSNDGKNQVREPSLETKIVNIAHPATSDNHEEKETSNIPMTSECTNSISRSNGDTDVTLCIGHVGQSLKRANEYRSSATKPLWMEQREKILSRSRPLQRVKDAACESKTETALIISNIERDCKESNAENKPTNLGEIRITALKSSDEPMKSHITEELAQQSSSRETIEQYNFNLHPAYELRRSQSENVRPVYKNQSAMKQIDHLLPFCLQTPNSNEDFLTVNTNQTGYAFVTSSKLDVLDEKKEESLCGEDQYSEDSKNMSDNNLAVNSMLEIYPRDRTGVKSSSKPVVVKPVARKPYVRPVPLKPLPESLRAIPFGRSISDPTASLIPSRGITDANRSGNGESRFLPRAMMDKKYATLELPRMVDDVAAPLKAHEIEESASESSEFSDGVTLDLSIADVSNLTTPTALVSKVEGGHRFDDQTESKMSEDERLHVNNYKSKKNRDPDSEAKQSEASSSQTSEAAAPLLARALGTYPLSDEISTDSFFRDRAIVAKQKWNLRGSSNQMSEALFEESSKDDDSRFSGSDTDGIWDIRQVESLFPDTAVKQVTQVHMERSFGVWHPFSVDYDKNVDSKVDLKDSLLHPPGTTFNTTPSRSKTPTRRNTSRVVEGKTDNNPDNTSTLPMKKVTDASSTSIIVDDVCLVNQLSKETPVSSIYLVSEASYPLQSTTSSNTNRTVVSNLLSSSTSGALLIGGRYNMLSANSGAKSSTKSTVSSSNSTSTYGPRQSTLQSYSNKSSASSSTTTTYGPKHSALLARIHALKESRLRRATRMAPYNRRPSTPLSR